MTWDSYWQDGWRIEATTDQAQAGDNTFTRQAANDNELPPTNPKRAFGVRKPSPQFIPPVAIIEESVVMALGASKYGAFNWQDNPVDATTYYSAAMRHLMSWFAGEDRDKESGASHLAHVRACMAILIDAAASGQLVDDRPKCASAAEAVEGLTKDEGVTLNEKRQAAGLPDIPTESIYK